MRRLATWIAMLGPVGRSPVVPATVASAVVAAIGWFVRPPGLPVFFACLGVGTAIAIWAAGEAEHVLGHDAGPIVVDEAVGQTITLLFAPHRVTVFVAAFVLFRVFDIWKPLGAHQAQSLPGGFGVVTDDAIAGVTAMLTLQALLWAQGPLGWRLL